jgi:hypothetical protein
MKRREFITLLGGGAAAAWPRAARAQQSERARRIGVLETSADDRNAKARQAAFRDRLGQLGRVGCSRQHKSYSPVISVEEISSGPFGMPPRKARTLRAKHY